LHSINAVIAINLPDVTIPELSLSSGKGSAKLTGTARRNRDGTFKAVLNVDTKKFPVTLTGMPKFSIDTQCRISSDISPDLTDVMVKFKNTTIKKPAEINKKAKIIPHNDNVTIKTRHASRPTPKSNFSSPLHVAIVSENPIRVTGKELDTFWDANLNIKLEDKDSSIDGKIKARNGTFILLGNNFTMSKGWLFFDKKLGNGAFLELDAYAQLPTATVYLNLSGNLMRPKLSLVSSPPLSEEQIFSLLITGNADNSKEASGMLGTMLTLKYPVINNFLYNKLGINQFNIGASQGGGASITLGKKISKRFNLYTIFNTNPDEDENEIEITIKTALGNNSSLDTTVGDENSSLGVFWRIPIKNSK
jgi:translocation and assembly module TamB